jgi:hypothetical protein
MDLIFTGINRACMNLGLSFMYITLINFRNLQAIARVSHHELCKLRISYINLF